MWIVTDAFKELKEKYLSGKNLQIIEVDGPSYSNISPYNKL